MSLPLCKSGNGIQVTKALDTYLLFSGKATRNSFKEGEQVFEDNKKHMVGKMNK